MFTVTSYKAGDEANKHTIGLGGGGGGRGQKVCPLHIAQSCATPIQNYSEESQ